MEQNLFNTLVKAGHKLGNNKYVLGRISGINYMVCGESEIQFANMYMDDGIIIRSHCTANQYAIFANIIEKQYPDLCVFNYTK